MGASQEPFVPTKVVSGHTSIPEATFVDWRYKGEGPPFYKLGKSVRYLLSEVDAWARSQAVAAHDESRGTIPGSPSKSLTVVPDRERRGTRVNGTP